MTAEQLEELLGKVTQGEWRVAGKASGYIVSNSESVVIAVVGDYRDDELLPFNKERWDADCALFAVAPSLARRVIAAENMLQYASASHKGSCITQRVWSDENDTCDCGYDAALTAYRVASKGATPQ